VIPHPFGLRSRDEVRAMAVQCATDIVALVTKERRDQRRATSNE
jgi:hypothetical protein